MHVQYPQSWSYTDSQNALIEVLNFQPEDGLGLRPEIKGVVW